MESSQREMEDIQECFEIAQHLESELVESIVDYLADDQDDQYIETEEPSHLLNDQFNSYHIESDRFEGQCRVDQSHKVDQHQNHVEVLNQ